MTEIAWHVVQIIFPIFTDYIRSIWEKLPDMRRVKIIKIREQIRHRPFSGWHVRIKAGSFVPDVPAFYVRKISLEFIITQEALSDRQRKKKGIEKRREWKMIKTDRYVQTEAAGMLYRLIPVTEEIIRCVIGKEEIKGNDSLIIEKKEYPAVEFAAEENERKAGTKRLEKVLASLELSSGRIEWKHADGTRCAYRIRRI